MLLKLQRKQKDNLLIDRLRARYLYSIGEAQSALHIGNLIGRDYPYVLQWFRTYQKGGIAALLTIKKRGTKRQSILNGAALEGLKTRLKDPKQGFRSYNEMLLFLKDTYSIVLPIKTLYSYFRNHLRVSFKRPRPFHCQQVEGAVDDFKTTIGNASTTAGRIKV